MHLGRAAGAQRNGGAPPRPRGLSARSSLAAALRPGRGERNDLTRVYSARASETRAPAGRHETNQTPWGGDDVLKLSHGRTLRPAPITSPPSACHAENPPSAWPAGNPPNAWPARSPPRPRSHARDIVAVRRALRRVRRRAVGRFRAAYTRACARFPLRRGMCFLCGSRLRGSAGIEGAAGFRCGSRQRGFVVGGAS